MVEGAVIADLWQTASTINEYPKVTKSGKNHVSDRAAPRRAGVEPIAPPGFMQFVAGRNIRDAAEQAKTSTSSLHASTIVSKMERNDLKNFTRHQKREAKEP